MNEKIEKLTQQVDIIKRPNTSGRGLDYTIKENQLEAFAELIIQECMEQCFSEDDEQRIAKHFGIDLEEEE